MSRHSAGRPGRLLIPAIVLFSLACAGADRSVDRPRPVDPEELLLRKAEIIRAEDRGVVDAALLSALEHPTPQIRGMALRTLGFIGDLSVRQQVESALGDAEPFVRRQAAFALGLLGDPASLPALNALAGDADTTVRNMLAAAYGVLGDPGAGDGLLVLLGDAESAVVTIACNALAGFPEASFAVEELIRHSASDEPPVAVAAARALGRLAADSRRLDFSARRLARKRLVMLADSPHAEIRAAAAFGLRIPSGVGEADALLMLGNDEDPRVRINAVRSFSFPGSPIDPFLRAALADPDDRIALATVQGLGRMRGPDVVDTLLNLIVFDERIWLKAVAVAELRRVDPDQAAALSNGFSNYEYPSVRLAVPGLLVGRSDPDSIEYATRLLRDAVPAVRRAAIPAMAGATGPLSEVLESVIASTHPLDRARLAEAAGWRLEDEARAAADREEAFAILGRLWDESQADSDATVQVAVVDAARRAGVDPTAKALLEQALSSTDRRVRERAAVHLSTAFGETRSSLAPDLPIEHYLEIVRWADKQQAAIVTVERAGFIPGRFTIRLNSRSTPLTSWNFARLAASGFFSGQPVERVLPTTSVRFGVTEDVEYPDEQLAIRNEPNAHWFAPGTVAMSRALPGSAGINWFITFVDRPRLIGTSTPFGRVVQNLSGVVFRTLPGDRIVKIETYEGTGREPLPALE